MTTLFEGILQSKLHYLLQCSGALQEFHSKWLQDLSESAVTLNASKAAQEQGVIGRRNSAVASSRLVRTHLFVGKAISRKS